MAGVAFFFALLVSAVHWLKEPSAILHKLIALSPVDYDCLNAKRQTPNAKRQTPNGERQTAKRRTANGDRF
jgi:hypothetical protein